MHKQYILFTTLVGVAGALIGVVLTIAAFAVLQLMPSPPPTQIVFPTPTGGGIHGSWVCDKHEALITQDGTIIQPAYYFWGHSSPSYPESYCPPWPAEATP